MSNEVAVHTDTRQKIINATLLVAAKNGFEGATTQRISRQAGVSEGIIYHYFRSKEELCVNLIKEKAAEFRAILLSHIKGCGSAQEKLEKLIDFHIEFFAGEKGLFRLLFSRPGGNPVMLTQALKFAILPYAGIIEGIIKDGMKERRFRQVDPMMSAINLIGMLQLTLIAIVLKAVPFSASHAGDNIKKIFFGGILR